MQLCSDAIEYALERVRGHTASNLDLTSLVIEVCWQAHVDGERTITQKQLVAAARQLGDTAGVRALHALILQDCMPLFRVLTIDPLEVQLAHPLIQDYFVARAICEGSRRMRVPPWQMSEFWSVTLQLGHEMGDAFGRGLMRAAINVMRRRN